MRRALWIAVPGLLLLTPACKHGQEEEGQPPAATPSTAPVTVLVTNKFALPVDVDVVGAGTRYRLGTVHPGMSSRFVIPPAILSTTGTVELQAHAASTSQIGKSGPMMLAPGSFVDFNVTPQLFNSTANIRQGSDK
jgi:hypothetical protein